MATLSTGGLSKFRKWYTQYRAIHGTEPPQELMDTALSAEMEADMASQDRSRQISLQEKGLDIQKEYQDKSLAQRQLESSQNLTQRQLEYAQNLKMQKDQIKSNEQAAMVSGVKDLASLGLEAKRTFSPATTVTPTSSYSSGLTGVSTARQVTPSAYSTYGTDSFGQGTDSAIDLSRYSGYGTDAGVSYDAGSPALSTTGQTTNNGINLSGVGTNLAIAAANRYVTPALAEKASETNVEAGKSLSVAGGALEGFTAGRGFGPVGMVVGTIWGTERVGYKQDNPKGEMFDKEYNKKALVAAMGGSTVGQMENESDSNTIKTAKALLTGGASKGTAQIWKKLKKLF